MSIKSFDAKYLPLLILQGFKVEKKERMALLLSKNKNTLSLKADIFRTNENF